MSAAISRFFNKIELPKLGMWDKLDLSIHKKRAELGSEKSMTWIVYHARFEGKKEPMLYLDAIATTLLSACKKVRTGELGFQELQTLSRGINEALDVLEPPLVKAGYDKLIVFLRYQSEKLATISTPGPSPS